MTRCGLRSLSWNWFLGAYVLLIGILLFAVPAHAASAPPVIDIPSITVMENAGSAPVVIVKTKASSYSRIAVQTVDGTARAGVDYKPINVTLTLANNATSTRLPVPIIDNATYQGSRQFALRLTVLRFGQVPASYTPITVTISDDEAPSAPNVVPGTAGEAAIADNFDPKAALEPMTTGQIVETDPLLGSYRMFCTPGQLRKDDPLVYPGQPGVSHLHQFIGNTGTNAGSNYQSLRTSGGSTCGTDQDHPVNRSAYWFPAMLDGVGDVVKPDFVSVYYKRNSNVDPLCSLSSAQHLGQCVPLPNGIRWVFGHDMKTMTNPGPPVSFGCWDSEDGSVSRGPATGYYHSIAEVAAAGCPVGAQLMIFPNSPSCWDGVNLDSADHRSHMAYATGPYYPNQQFQACPADHPYVIPNMELILHFTVDANLKTWHLSSDEMEPGAAAGSTFHVDYWEAWSPPIKATWTQYCIDGHLSCSSGGLGDGTDIKGAGVPNGGFPKHQLVPLSSIP